MQIIPYYIEEQTPKTKVAWVFLMKGGKNPWQTDEKGKLTNKFIVDNYLTPNGFVGQVACVKGDIMYFQVKPAAMKMGDFYTWTDFLKDAKEIPSDTDIWRPFVLFDDKAWTTESKDSVPFLEGILG